MPALWRLSSRMKTLLLSLALAVATGATASAQNFESRAARNTIIGGVAGAIIGGHNDHPVEGALIGAAAGYAITAATTPRHGYYESCAPVRYEERVIIGRPACPPPRRTVVVTRPVVVVPPPPVVVYREPIRRHRHVERVVVVPDRDCRSDRRVVYEYDQRRW
jgi:hypothetical protein